MSASARPSVALIQSANKDNGHFGPGARYVHYKGGFYKVITTSEAKDDPSSVVVVYRSEQDYVVRHVPLLEWFEEYEIGRRRYAPCDDKGARLRG